jgi:hypothetical protein
VRQEEAPLLHVCIIVVLLECCESGPAVVLGTAATLLVAKVLPGIRCEES